MSSKFLNLSTDNTLGGNSPSETKAVSEKAIKEYVDNHSGGGGSYTAGTGLQLDNNEFSIVQSDSQIVENFTKVGNGTLTADYLYSGTNNAYLQMNVTLPLSSANSWEFRTKYHYLGSTTNGTIISYPSPPTTYDKKTIFFETKTVLLSSNGSSWDIADVSFSNSMSSGTSYYYKFGFTGSQYYVKRGENGWDGTFTDLWTLSSTTKVYNSAPVILMCNGYSLTGNQNQMDLKETSVIIDGSTYWQAVEDNSGEYTVAKATENLYGLVKPDGTTITVNDGVISSSGVTVDQTYNSTSTNAQSGVAIAGELANYVTTNTSQTISQSAVKTFNGRVNFLGSGDANAVYITTNTRFDVHGTSKTILGFANDTFLINHSSYALNLRGSGTRPTYNSSSYLALTSDIPTAASDIGAQETLVSGTNIKTINNQSILGSGNISVATSAQGAKADTALQNTAEGTNSLTINGTAGDSTAYRSINIGYTSSVGVGADDAIAIGASATASGARSIAIGGSYLQGLNAIASVNGAIQIGSGTNSTQNSLSVGWGSSNNYQLLDGTTGYIPNARINMDSTPTSSSINTVTSGGVYTALNSKQDTLISGTNIKTINGNSIVGSGNISTVTSVNGVSPDENGYVYNNIIQERKNVTNDTVSLELRYQIYKKTVNGTDVTFTFSPSGFNITSAYIYTFELIVDMQTVQTLTFPNNVTWQDNETPTMTSTGIYMFAFRTIDAGTTWLGNLQGVW